MSDKKKILVVDDEPGIRDFLEMYLRRRGYYVVTCADGQQALDLVLSGQFDYDLLLTDNSMPRLRGTDLARRLRENGRAQPAILITADAHALFGEPPEGINLVMGKPFANGELLAEIVRLLAAGDADGG